MQPMCGGGGQRVYVRVRCVATDAERSEGEEQAERKGNSRCWRARVRTNAAGSAKPVPTLSTPLAVTSVELAIAASSPALPFKTVVCHVLSRPAVVWRQWGERLGCEGEELTVRGVPAVRGGADTDGVEHDGLAIDVRVTSCIL